MFLSRIYRGVGDESQPIPFHDFDTPFEAEPQPAPFAEEEGAAPVAFSGDAPCAPAPPVDLEALREEAFVRGRREGQAAAEAQLASATQSLAAALEEVGRLRRSLLTNSTHDMLRLVMAVAEQVIRTTVAEKEDAILQILKNALQAAVKSDEFHVRVNPEDLATVTAHQPLFLASVSGLKNIVVEGDPAIARGGCLVESALGEVDATVETQLEEIRRHLAQAVG